MIVHTACASQKLHFVCLCPAGNHIDKMGFGVEVFFLCIEVWFLVTVSRVCDIKLVVLWFSHSRALGFWGWHWKQTWAFQWVFHCKAISISTTTSSWPAAFPVLEFSDAHWTSSFSIERPDSYETALLSSISSLSSWNKEAMYFFQSFLYQVRTWSGRSMIERFWLLVGVLFWLFREFS